MKQIIQSYKTGEMKLEKVPRPQVGKGMVLVETRASLVSAGTEKMLVDLAKKSLLGKAKARPDLVKKVIATARKEGIKNTFNKVKGRLDTPIPLGYSCAGIVRAVGAGVDKFQPGDRVACGGAGYANHADYNVVPKNLCVHIPDFQAEVSEKDLFAQAASATVGAIALQGVRQTHLTLGERVCVIGLGLLGQITVQLCKANGCMVIGADIDHNKVRLSQKLGADYAFHSRELEDSISSLTEGYGADAVIITAAGQGNELVTLAGDISRTKGRVVVVGFVGMDLPREVFYKKELDVRLSMSYGPGRYDVEYEERGNDYPLPYVRWTEQRNMQTILELIASSRLDIASLITHRFPFGKALDSYDMILQGKEPFLGVVLEYETDRSEDAGRIILDNSPREPADTVGLGVIGAGNFAKGVLLPRLQKNSDVRFEGIVTARGMSAKDAGNQFGFRYCADDNQALYEDAAINTLLVATRHNLHGREVLAALRHDKNVFVEKPLATTIDELQEISALYAKKVETGGAPIVMVGFNRRFSPFIQTIKESIAGSGAPIVISYTVNAGFIPKDSWVQDPEEGGGRIIGEVCHFIDLIRFLAASPVRAIMAASVQSNDQAATDRDSVCITITYQNGSLANILYHALGNSEYPKEVLEVAAGRQTYLLNDYRSLAIFAGKNRKQKSSQDKGFDAELNAFIAAVKNGTSSPISINEQIETTLATFAVHRSLDTGGSVDLRQYANELDIAL
ncbi:MAG: oxidoreductase [Deltaproteobacteria bacterium]|nr:MAG: oxidoreductase [Deltaproteobacteria bacterium]